MPSFPENKTLINGAWVSARSGKSFAVTNPATAAVVGHAPDLDASDAATAIDAAQAAFPAWKKMLGKERGVILRRWAELIEKNTEDLARLMTTEQGKPLSEARSEIKSGYGMVEWCAEEARRVRGDYAQSHKADARMLVSFEPVGVVAAITPWNFPVSMITRKVAPALAAGCTVVLKPAEDTPLSALALAKLAEEAGVPKGVLNIITCSLDNVVAVGQTLCADPRVKKISFTGSTEVGKILIKQSADTVKRVSLELGGNAPFIIFDSADLDAAVEGAMISKFRNAGQTCICANRIYVQKGVFDAVAAKLEAKIKAFKMGPGDVDGVTMGPLINRAAADKVQMLVDDAAKGGAKIVTGGKAGQGSFYEPSLIVQMTDKMKVASDEIFGPVAALFPFTDEAEVIARANNTVYGLASYFYTRDMAQAFRVSEGLEYGMVGVNEPLLSSELAPFGGIKQSGFGREGGHYALNDFLNMKYTLMGGIR